MAKSKNGAHNPYRPGAGHMPPHLAGRDAEITEFRDRVLAQDVILENMVLTGLRGVGKTVLLDTLKPVAIDAGWVWVGTDLSESASVSEDRLAMRMIADLAPATAALTIGVPAAKKIGFRHGPSVNEIPLNFETLVAIYNTTPGLAHDKLKAVLETVWEAREAVDWPGIVFAYDEAQNLSDHADKNEYPLSLLLDVFQSIQKKGVRFLLVLTGLPTLFPKLVEARTFAERMFHVVMLDRLNQADTADAIETPLKSGTHKFRFLPNSVQFIYVKSGGYPYFIQFICREAYDTWNAEQKAGREPSANMDDIIRKLDADFFAGRWSRATDRQRELLAVIARLNHADNEFTIQEVVEESKQVLEKPFKSSHVNQMLVSLGAAGLVFKNRHGKYSFAVPLLGEFVRRQRVFTQDTGLSLFDGVPPTP